MELILHHFDASPFAEKIRLVMGFKGLAWRSVTIPMIMPKPDLTALTGGYRKTPVLQIGADIYCDTQCIARELERRFPARTLFPGGSEGLCAALGYWSDTGFFQTGAGLSLGTNTALPSAVLRDRRELFRFLDFNFLSRDLPHLYARFDAHLALLASMLADGREYLLGATPSWADMQGYFPVWMCRGNIRDGESLLAAHTQLEKWEARMAAIGHGEYTELDAESALAVAREHSPATEAEVLPGLMAGLAVGTEVTVTPEDYGAVPVTGELVRLTHEDIALRRRDERAGEVVVHFPRLGYRVEKSV
ncbi:glutathione S-transferase family protein [Kineobactrum sediminis]|uniref:Glutathione S-transferase family protein n=1 Tax=Kineobactrum sediminis TaxID=1905677 RepID=A0A2N5XZI2_9GAMM|nr:glutathione S-transferase family protein [Kineobactrum sediminis]PLW81554.1 glutathione S-transferase family protein [Kineobactrum sediminis]